MAGKRKPCEFCEDDNWNTYDENKKGLSLYVEIYPMNNMIGITAYANDECGETIEESITLPMNYCPNCGRKLGF